MSHARFIDPNLAARCCTNAEQEVVRLVNREISWTNIVELTGRSRGQVRREWASANRKVNGTQHMTEDEKAHKRATEQNDPDAHLVGQGVPLVGKRGAIPGTVPGGHPRPWEIRHDRLDREGK